MKLVNFTISCFCASVLLIVQKPAVARTAQGQLGIRLTIAPSCAEATDHSYQIGQDRAEALVRQHLEIDNRATLNSQTYRFDPEKWFVEVKGRPALLVDRCTGEITLVGAAFLTAPLGAVIPTAPD